MIPNINLFLFCALPIIVFGDELMLVQTLFRHGDRTPTGTYPKDPYQEDSWPFSWGQLTVLGMKQHFEQGMKLRDRYTIEYPFMPTDYKDYNVYVRSTDYNRTLMSAYAHLAGFYMDSNSTHPEDGHWPNRWTPVPVHTVDVDTDDLLSTDAHCPRRTEIHESRKHAASFQSFMSTQKPLLEQISKSSGIDTDYYESYSDFSSFYGSTLIEKIYNKTVPSWITDNLWETFCNGKWMADDYLDGSDHFGQGSSTEMIKLTSGVLLKTMIDNMRRTVYHESKVKFYMYSAHDTTVASFLRALEAKDEVLGIKLPEYAATLILELWKKSDGHHYVRVLYIKDVASDPVVITPFIDGCKDEFCWRDDFDARSEPFMSQDIKTECQKKQ
ncbi:hypothetical protein FO519_007490 [Halicephalobus sp. NKZ332]|nr:hypothetical protein FO519_007490 [Halicephalobus sp. NKZ332]